MRRRREKQPFPTDETYIKNPNDTTHKLSQFVRVVGQTINTQKSVAFIWLSHREQTDSTIFTCNSNNSNKILRNKSHQKMCKTLMDKQQKLCWKVLKYGINKKDLLFMNKNSRYSKYISSPQADSSKAAQLESLHCFWWNTPKWF